MHNTLENSVIVSGNNSISNEKEREEIIDRALEIYLSNEDDLDSEDEHLVDELMVFNVDNDTSDVSDADE